MIWFIIYLVGFALSAFLDIKYTLRNRNYTYSDIFPTLIWSLLSWIAVIIMLLMSIDGDTIIFKKKG